MTASLVLESPGTGEATGLERARLDSLPATASMQASIKDLRRMSVKDGNLTQRCRSSALVTHHRAAAAAPRVFSSVRLSAKATSRGSAGTQSSSSSTNDQQQQQQQQQCPFLAGVTPPQGNTPWYKRPWQLLQPRSWQQEELGGRSVVMTPPALGLPQQYVIGDGPLAQAVFNAEPEAVHRALPIAGVGALLGDDHLLAVQDPQHKYLRGLMAPAFTPDSIASLTPRMVTVLGRYLERWADAGAAVGGAQELKLMTFEFIIAVIMGQDYPASTLAHLNSLFATWIAGTNAWPYLDLPGTRFHKALGARQGLEQWLQQQVSQARQVAAAGSSVPGVLGKLLAAQDEQGNGLSDSQLISNLLVLLFAGHDTSSSTLLHVLKQLQLHPEARAALRQEQQAISDAHGPNIDGRLLREMPYAEAVIRETLRLDSIVSGLFRKSISDMQLGQYSVPEGTLLYLPLQLLAMRDPRWAEQQDVTAFKPERMLQGAGQKQGWLMPFGYGPRFCVGYALAMAEMKVFLALLSRSYDFSVDLDTTWSATTIGDVPANGMPLTVTRRSST